MHRIFRLLTAFVFPGEYRAGILAPPKPHKAACYILLFINSITLKYTLYFCRELRLIPFAYFVAI